KPLRVTDVGQGDSDFIAAHCRRSHHRRRPAACRNCGCAAQRYWDSEADNDLVITICSPAAAFDSARWRHEIDIESTGAAVGLARNRAAQNRIEHITLRDVDQVEERAGKAGAN